LLADGERPGRRGARGGGEWGASARRRRTAQLCSKRARAAARQLPGARPRTHLVAGEKVEVGNAVGARRRARAAAAVVGRRHGRGRDKRRLGVAGVAHFGEPGAIVNYLRAKARRDKRLLANRRRGETSPVREKKERARGHTRAHQNLLVSGTAHFQETGGGARWRTIGESARGKCMQKIQKKKKKSFFRFWQPDECSSFSHQQPHCTRTSAFRRPVCIASSSLGRCQCC